MPLGLYYEREARPHIKWDAKLFPPGNGAWGLQVSLVFPIALSPCPPPDCGGSKNGTAAAPSSATAPSAATTSKASPPPTAPSAAAAYLSPPPPQPDHAAAAAPHPTRPAASHRSPRRARTSSRSPGPPSNHPPQACPSSPKAHRARSHNRRVRPAIRRLRPQFHQRLFKRLKPRQRLDNLLQRPKQPLIQTCRVIRKQRPHPRLTVPQRPKNPRNHRGAARAEPFKAAPNPVSLNPVHLLAISVGGGPAVPAGPPQNHRIPPTVE